MSSSILQFLLVGSDAGASRAIEKVGASAELAGAKMAKSAKTSEAAWASVTGALNKAGKASAVATVAFAAYGVDQAAKFQKLTNVYVTAAGESQKNLKLVQNGVLDVATATGTAWQEVASATYIAEKANLRGADALTVVKAAAQGAKEENANLTTVVQGVTSVMASYHLKAGDAVSVTNQLKTASGEAKTTFEDYVGSLSTVLPIASAAKISLADVLGIVSQLTQHGTSANESTQEVAFAIRNLTGGNRVASAEMAQLGIDSVDVAQKLGDGPGGRGLAGTINYLSRTVLEKLGPAGTVLLSTFNASQRAAADAQTEFTALPPQAQKLADAYRKGTVSLKDYRTDLKALPADQSALVQQFVATENGAKGFQAAIRNGGPAAQTYSQALQKMLGGVNGLNVALQTSGTSSAETAEKIKRIADSAKNSGKDVSGWASTLGLTSTQLDIMKQRAQAVAIHVGQDLLPILDKTLAVLSKHPGILKAVAYGIAGLGAAWALVKIGSVLAGLGRLTTALLGVRTAAVEASAAEAGVGAAGAGAGAAGAGVGAGAAGRFLLPAAGGGAGRTLFAGLEGSALTKIAVPIAVTIFAVKSGQQAIKALQDLGQHQYGKALTDGLNNTLIKGLTFGISGGIAKALKSGDWVDAIPNAAIAKRLLGIGGKLTGSIAPGGLKPPSAAPWSAFWSSVDDRSKIADFQDSLKNINTLVVQNSHSLVGNSYAATTNRDGITALVRQAQAAASAYARTTGKQSDYTAALKLAIPAIENAAAANGLNKQQVDNLINSLIHVPKETPANVTLTGTKEAQSELADLEQRLRAMAQPIIVPIVAQAGLTGVASPNYVPTLPQILGGQNAGFGSSGPTGIPGGTGHALGGVARGWAWVGEQGPELVHVGSSSRVLTNRESRAVGGAPVIVHISALDSRSVSDWLARGGARQIQEAINRRSGFGGNSL